MVFIIKNMMRDFNHSLFWGNSTIINFIRKQIMLQRYELVIQHYLYSSLHPLHTKFFDSKYSTNTRFDDEKRLYNFLNLSTTCRK